MHIPRLSTHADRLERYLGTEEIERLSLAAKDWYGPPIPVLGVPGGAVFARRGGDFVGPIQGLGLVSMAERVASRVKRNVARYAKRLDAQARRGSLGDDGRLYAHMAGFSSFSDMIAEATANGKMRQKLFSKVGTTGVVAGTNTLWGVGAMPAAGAAAAAAPGGTVYDDSSTGGMLFDNPTGGDYQMFIGGFVSANAVNTLVVYDRLCSTLRAASSLATEAVTTTPTRYTNTVQGSADSAEGNFLFIEAFSALGSFAHNWTVCQYTDQSGNPTITLPTVTGLNPCIINRLDMPTSTWFCPLASGDTGILKLTQTQCSVNTVTGSALFTIGHVLGMLPALLANVVNPVSVADQFGGIGPARVFDDACIAMLELTKPATTATTYSGVINTLYG